MTAEPADEYDGDERRRRERRTPEGGPGDVPFGPEEALFGWLPRAGAGAILLSTVILLSMAWSHHGDFRLIPREDGASLERGVFAPWGWSPWVPEGAAAAWSAVPWSLGDDAPPLEGDLGDLADVFADLLTQRVEATLGDPLALDTASAQVEAFAGWYSTEFGEEPEPTARARALVQTGVETRRSQEEAVVAAVAAEEEAHRLAILAQQELVSERERSLARERAHNAARRSLLIRVEDFLSGLPPAGEGSPQEEVDRGSIEDFIHSMDTPLPGALDADSTEPASELGD